MRLVSNITTCVPDMSRVVQKPVARFCLLRIISDASGGSSHSGQLHSGWVKWDWAEVCEPRSVC